MIDIALLKERVNCIDVASHFLSLPITKSGDRCVSPLRPGAKNKTSFLVETDFFYDFGSGSGGDCIDMLALAKYNGNRGEAIRALASYAGMNSEINPTEWKAENDKLNDNVRRWHEELTPSFRAYLHSRRINDYTIDELLLGRCDDGRLCIPYIKNGRAVYYITRAMQNSMYPDSKYRKCKVNEFCEHIVWGLDSLKRGGNTLIIAEGAFDVMSFWQEGYPCLSAITGHFSKAQLPVVLSSARMFKRVLLTYDNDPVTKAGQKFTVKMAKVLLANRVPFVVGNIPDEYKDISEYYAAGGDLKEIVKSAKSGILFLAKQMNTEDEFEKFARDSCRYMNPSDVVKLFNAAAKNDFDYEWLKTLKAECKKPPSEDYVVKAVLKKHKLKFNRKIGFFRYNGKYWKEIGDETVQSYIADELGIHRTGNKLSSILKVVKSATVTEDIFNIAPVINFMNGTLELEPQIRFREHSEADNVTYCLDYPYAPEAKSPEWDRFLFSITDCDGRKIDLLQEACGYTLFTDNKYQTAFFLIGSGSNGKSVFLSILQKIFGQSNITNVEMSALAQDFQRVQLSSSILNISTETRSDVNGAESYFKQIVAGDTISACYKSKPYFSFVPRAKLWISCNDFIKPKDTSDGFLRRLKFINFPMKYCDNPKAENERKIDREIESRISTPENLSGIFNWVLQGYIELKQCGRFSEPDDERQIKEEFKELINPVIVFIKEYQLPEPTYSVSNKTFFNDYKDWCEENGHHHLSNQKFKNQVSRYLKEYRNDIVPYRTKSERGYIRRQEENK